MAKLVIMSRDGEEHRLALTPGYTLMETIRDVGMDELLALCGGCCSCATCHVHVDLAFTSNLPPISEDENDLLASSEHREPTSRIACQMALTEHLDGLAVRIAEQD